VDKGNSYTKLGGRIEFGGPAHWVTHRGSGEKLY